MAKTYDAIIVGAGHNGMICAAYLAKAGKSVLGLERRHLVGGATVTEEHYPGFKYTVCSYVISLLRPHIINDLELPRFGFELLPLDGTLTPSFNGERHLMRWPDSGQTRLFLGRASRQFRRCPSGLKSGSSRLTVGAGKVVQNRSGSHSASTLLV